MKFGSGESQLRIAQISDIHISKLYDDRELDKIVKRVNAQHPDLVFFTGDLFDNYAQYKGDSEIIADKLGQIDSTIGKYAVWGNHDYGGGASRVYRNIMEKAGFVLLKNNGDTISLTNGKELFIGGLDDALLGSPSVEEMLSTREYYDYSIVLAHEPDMSEDLLNTGTQLVLSGHSHGEQVHLPIKVHDHLLSSKYTRGLYKMDNDLMLYVNRGLGTTNIPIRFGAIPEISIFDLYL